MNFQRLFKDFSQFVNFQRLSKTWKNVLRFQRLSKTFKDRTNPAFTSLLTPFKFNKKTFMVIFNCSILILYIIYFANMSVHVSTINIHIFQLNCSHIQHTVRTSKQYIQFKKMFSFKKYSTIGKQNISLNGVTKLLQKLLDLTIFLLNYPKGYPSDCSSASYHISSITDGIIPSDL